MRTLKLTGAIFGAIMCYLSVVLCLNKVLTAVNAGGHDDPNFYMAIALSGGAAVFTARIIMIIKDDL